MIVKSRESKVWLLWTGLLLTVALAAVLLGSSLEASQAAPLQTVGVTKEVNIAAIEPGQVPAPLYTVTFSNSTGADIVLDAVTDTLPTDFVFIDMHASSGWLDDPIDEVEPEIVWGGPVTVSANSTLTFVYAVYVPASVPPSTTLYYNSVEAVTDGGVPVGPASVGLLVGSPNVSVSKTAWPIKVNHGEQVTYTVVFSNSGELTGTLETLVDTLDPALSYVEMGPDSDVIAEPQVIGDMLVWGDDKDIPPGEMLTYQYVVETAVGTGWSWPQNYVEGDLGDETVSAHTTIQVGPESGYAYIPLVTKSYRHPRFTVEKSAEPAAVLAQPNQVVSYTVTISNVGSVTGTLTVVSDTLPAGFTFQGMDPSSDVQTGPNGTTGPIGWHGTWDIPPDSQMTFIYDVSANSASGEYVNHAYVTAPGVNVPAQPASATVLVGEPIAGLSAANDGPTTIGNPTTLSASVTAGTNVTYEWDFGDNTTGSGQVVQHTYAAIDTYTARVTATNGFGQETATTIVTVNPAILLEEHFENGIGQWTKFLNYWRLTEQQWYHGPNDGVNSSGAATQDCTLGKENPERGAEDALLMYLGEGSENWTNYRVETKILLRGGMSNGNWILEGGYPVGLWVRGHYQAVGEADTAGWVTGYYIVIGGKSTKQMYVRLAQLQTLTDCWGPPCPDSPEYVPGNEVNLYDFNNPHTFLENKMTFSFERNQWYTLVVEVEDDWIRAWVNGTLAIEYQDTKEPFLTGTVGLKTYKSWTVSFDDIIVEPLP